MWVQRHEKLQHIEIGLTMLHERGIASLWARRIRLYARIMANTLYNIRLLGDAPLRKQRLDIFLDAYGASLDAFPECRLPYMRRGADALWGDFVRVSQDLNHAVRSRIEDKTRE